MQMMVLREICHKSITTDNMKISESRIYSISGDKMHKP